MNKSIFLLFVLLSCHVCSSFGQQASTPTPDPDMKLFELDDLVSELDNSGKPWLGFMNGENVLSGIYKLKAGSEDGQSPHRTDEVYYVVSGKAKFQAGGKEVEVKTGSILFVKAQVEHKFFDIEEDLVMVVFFDK